MAIGQLKLTVVSKDEIVIPEKIKVHLGAPDTPAQIISVDFIQYIKTVSACEIHPLWPRAAQETAVYLIISKTLNRLVTETRR